ncbi:MAG TPA: uroporphyrinogen-III synthase [Burkholderiaceae bacterium]|jgi:uroporphyrinogen-III synthase
MPNPVVITRPLAQAGAFAQRVMELGRQAVVFPLLEIHRLADTSLLQAALADIDSYAMVSFVSPNAIDASFAIRQSWPTHVALSVMGDGSRRTLAEHGINSQTHTIISPQDPEQTDSQTLLDALDLSALRGKKVLIIRGESGRELLADALRDAGALVTQVAAYRRTAPELDAAGCSRLQKLIDTPNDWMITSSEALRILVQMARQISGDDGVVKMQQQKIIVPHARIAETAKMLGFNDIVLTGSGDDSLLAALSDC